KVAVVTGGASGLGLGCCERLAAEGAAVGILDINSEAAIAATARIVAAGGKAFACEADVTDPASLSVAVEQVVREFGRLDVAVNSAGIGGIPTPLQDVAAAIWNKTIAINLTGVFHSMQAEYPHIVASGGGAIVNLSSICGVVGHGDGAPYVASKHGVIGLTRAAALSWGPQNVRVVAVCPTFVRTSMTEDYTSEQWDALAQAHTLRRLPQASDIAATICFLASEEARAVTGSVHMVDAGYTAG
ncbi:MAG: SDR family NAD(P)-dependent oxidoreductase, partial [Novosphingobium sp.]